MIASGTAHREVTETVTIGSTDGMKGESITAKGQAIREARGTETGREGQETIEITGKKIERGSAIGIETTTEEIVIVFIVVIGKSATMTVIESIEERIAIGDHADVAETADPAPALTVGREMKV